MQNSCQAAFKVFEKIGNKIGFFFFFAVILSLSQQTPVASSNFPAEGLFFYIYIFVTT